MELGLLTKLDKRNKATSKKIDDDIVSENCDVIAIFFLFTDNLEQSVSQILDL